MEENMNGKFGEALEEIHCLLNTRLVKANEGEFAFRFRWAIEGLGMEVSIQWLLNEVSGIDKPHYKDDYARHSKRESYRNKIKKLILWSDAKTYKETLWISTPIICGNTIRKNKTKNVFDMIWWGDNWIN